MLRDKLIQCDNIIKLFIRCILSIKCTSVNFMILKLIISYHYVSLKLAAVAL